jgi:hypothetical protein
LYDQTTTGLKGFRFIEGANHFYFTDDITYAPEVNAILTRAQHHEIARTYWATWCVLMIYGDRPSYVRIAGDKEIQWSSNFTIHRILSNPRQITVDNFEQQPPNLLRNTLGGTNQITGFISPVEMLLANTTYFHETHGMAAKWNTPAEYNADLASNLDIGGYSYISVNMVQLYGSTFNPSGQQQRFHISIVDSAGNSAKLDNTDVAPWPYPFTTNTNGPIKSVLKTFRFPIEAFTAKNPLLDLTSMRHVVVDFDITSMGEFAMDDVVITQ